MHGKALALTPYGDRSIRLVEAPIAPRDRDSQVERPARGIDLHALRLNIMRNRMLMLTILLLVLAAGAVSIWLAKPVYSARTTLQIDPPASLMLGTENVTDAGSTANDRVLHKQVDLLASRPTAQNVATKLNLANNPSFLREVGLQNQPAGPKRSARVTTALHDRLSVSSPRDTNIVAIRFDSHDPAFAARTANTFAETFIRDSLKRRLTNYDYSRRFFHGQLEVKEARLEQAERNLANYARSAGLVDAGNAAASLVELDAAYSRAQANRMEAQQRWEQAISTPAMGNPIAIIDRAHTPSVPAYPRPATNMALTALAGVVLALGAGLARGRTNETVHGPGEVARDFDAPLLGVVPLPKDEQGFALALSDPRSRGSEAHHAIFLALDRAARTADHKVLLLTSGGPNEGKSLVAVKLSANFAAAGKKVLVIDADMRRGSLHRILGLSNQRGLADLLARDSTDALTNVAQYCADRGFSVVPRGQPATNPAELLASRRFAELLDEAVTLYDMVIMDGPPVLGRADAPRLSGMADATVFVLHTDRTSREQATLAMRRLSETGAGPIGLVISKDDSARDVGASDDASGYDDAAVEAEEFVPEAPPRQVEQERQVAMAV